MLQVHSRAKPDALSWVGSANHLPGPGHLPTEAIKWRSPPQHLQTVLDPISLLGLTWHHRNGPPWLVLRCSHNSQTAGTAPIPIVPQLPHITFSISPPCVPRSACFGSVLTSFCPLPDFGFFRVVLRGGLRRIQPCSVVLPWCNPLLLPHIQGCLPATATSVQDCRHTTHGHRTPTPPHSFMSAHPSSPHWSVTQMQMPQQVSHEFQHQPH